MIVWWRGSAGSRVTAGEECGWRCGGAGLQKRDTRQQAGRESDSDHRHEEEGIARGGGELLVDDTRAPWVINWRARLRLTKEIKIKIAV